MRWKARGRVSAHPACVDRLVAAGSSPSISLHDFDANRRVGSVNLTMDTRNTIHGLEVWPFDVPTGPAT